MNENSMHVRDRLQFSPEAELPQAAHTLDQLRTAFRDVPEPFGLRLWNGETAIFGTSAGGATVPRFTLVVRTPATFRELVDGHDPLRLADAYFRGDLDIEGDFFAALMLKDRSSPAELSWTARLASFVAALRSRSGNTTGHERVESRAAIAFHSDVSNDFFSLWLDPAMVYSCAYFERPDDPLEKAQSQKLDHICRKLQLRRGDSLLDIGSGWGALIIHAALHYGVRARGITLSRAQFDVTRERLAQAGLLEQVTVELRDYRDLPGEAAFDKIASVGMFEQIGAKNMPEYCAVAHRMLKPGGLFLNHGITQDAQTWDRAPASEFISRHVYQDVELDTVSHIQQAIEHANFEITDVEALRAHYALTLRHWVERLEQQHESALDHVSEATYRVWRLYMATSALQFEAGELGVYQVLARKRAAQAPAEPLTRRHLYA